MEMQQKKSSAFVTYYNPFSFIGEFPFLNPY